MCRHTNYKVVEQDFEVRGLTRKKGGHRVQFAAGFFLFTFDNFAFCLFRAMISKCMRTSPGSVLSSVFEENKM